MQPYNTTPAEDAVLSVLGGVPIAEAAKRAGTSPGRLAAAVELYRAAGRAALEARPGGWHQVYIQFADYPPAASVLQAYLLPVLRDASVERWWFLRKHPCWRLRIHHRPDVPEKRAVTHVAEALDSAVSRGGVKEWTPSLYEPEIVAFGGPDGMAISHALFHTDSVGVLDYLRQAADRTEGLLDGKATSLLLAALFLRAAGLEWGEQGDVWGQVEARRPLPDDVPTDRVSAMAEQLQRLLLLDAGPVLAAGPLAPLRSWATGMEDGGRALAAAAREGRLGLGLRGILARHILFHWNRMGFTTRQQAIWSRAAREAALGR
ncbi:thiopeptide-type bacteriocin biosynthesis protein [Streptomyces tirandamycinicus]|uniref:Bacteriocin biosynthesis protein n=1 Tax=Streptomyces tirandamycinicus TaxID=2174846 RepID=A0A2S1T230_9ACTN|nr:thiopeptide-type bacteriocin biosynthesis protein [Streptomyces tirandamycinicus]AWI32710.1 bacteriocin biosynthesis protein [Streptomyces tirandamycinicus]